MSNELDPQFQTSRIDMPDEVVYGFDTVNRLKDFTQSNAVDRALLITDPGVVEAGVPN